MDIGSTTTMYAVSLVFVRGIGMVVGGSMREAILARKDLRDGRGLALNSSLFN